MEELNSMQKDAYFSMFKQEAEGHLKETVKTNFGKHFLKIIGKLKNNKTFSKIQTIEEIDKTEINFEGLEKEREFYISKIRNLKIKLNENRIAIEDKFVLAERQRLLALFHEGYINELKSKLENFDLRLTNTEVCIRSFKSELNQ